MAQTSNPAPFLFTPTPAHAPIPHAHASSFRILTWNLRHGGGNQRTPAQALALRELAPDVVVLTEFREARGSQLASMLRSEGLAHSIFSQAPRHAHNRVAILARWPLEPIREHASHQRLLLAQLPHLNLTILGVHVPDDSAPTQRADVWQRVTHLAKSIQNGRALVAGDFNTARTTHSRDAAHASMGLLATYAYQDCVLHARELTHATAGPHAQRTNPALDPTWFPPTPPSTPVPDSTRSTTQATPSRRIDAIWASHTLFAQCTRAWQDASCVQRGESDHAMVIADFALSGPNPPPGTDPRTTPNAPHPLKTTAFLRDCSRPIP